MSLSVTRENLACYGVVPAIIPILDVLFCEFVVFWVFVSKERHII